MGGDGGDGSDGSDGADGAAAAAAAGLGTGDTGAPSDAGIGGGNAPSSNNDNAPSDSNDTGDNIGTGALSAQADAQAAMAALGQSLGFGETGFGTVGQATGTDTGNLGYGFGNIGGFGFGPSISTNGFGIGTSLGVGEVGNPTGVDAGNLGLGVGTVGGFGFGPANEGFGIPGANLGAFNTAAINDQAAINAVMGVAMPGISNSTPAAPFGTIAAPPTNMDEELGITDAPPPGKQGSLTGPSVADAQAAVANLGVSLTGPSVAAQPGVAVASLTADTPASKEDAPVAAPVTAPVTAPPTQTDPQTLPSITVDAPHNVPTGKSAPTTGPGDPGHGPGASPGQAAAAALGITGIATGIPGDSVATAPGFNVASFAAPPDVSVDIGREGLLGKTLSEQQADIDARDAKQQQEEKPALFDERFPTVPKSLEEQLKDMIVEIDKSLAKPSPPPAPPLDQSLTDKDKEAPHEVPAPPSPPISAPYGINPADDPNALTPSFSPAVPAPPSPPISSPYGINPADDPNALTPSFSPAVPAPPSPPISAPYSFNPVDDPNSLTPAPPTDFSGRFGFPTSIPSQGVIGPSVSTFGTPPSGTIGNPNISMTSPTTTAPPTTFSLPAPLAPISNVPQGVNIPGTVAAPVPSTLSAPPPAIVAPPPAPPPLSPLAKHTLDDLGRQVAKQAAPQAKGQTGKSAAPTGKSAAPTGKGTSGKGTIGSNITGFTPGSNLGSKTAPQGSINTNNQFNTAAQAMQALWNTPVQ